MTSLSKVFVDTFQLLRGLVRDGLLTRTQCPAIPPRVDYALTPLGQDLARAMAVLDMWTREHSAAVLEARVIFDRETVKP